MGTFGVVLVVMIAVLAIVVVVDALRLGIGPVPTSRRVRRSVFDQLPQSVEGTVYELGAGWGTLAIDLGSRFPRAQVVGYEAAWIPVAICWLRSRFTSTDNVLVKSGDFFSRQLSDAGLVVCYLYPGAMDRLSKKLAEELRPGAVVITHTFALPGWIPESVKYSDDLYRTPVYRYTIQYPSNIV